MVAIPGLYRDIVTSEGHLKLGSLFRFPSVVSYYPILIQTYLFGIVSY